jgi:hypothetical protein
MHEDGGPSVDLEMRPAQGSGSDASSFRRPLRALRREGAHVVFSVASARHPILAKGSAGPGQAIGLLADGPSDSQRETFSWHHR